MSVREHKSKRKKGKFPRNRISRKMLHTRKIRKRIFKKRGWKLAYPEYFQVIDEFPYIIKRNSEEENTKIQIKQKSFI